MQNLEEQIEHDYFIDAKQLYCPEPIMLLHQALSIQPQGAKILLATKDKAAIRDVQNFTKHLNHKLLQQTQQGSLFYFLVEKC